MAYIQLLDTGLAGTTNEGSSVGNIGWFVKHDVIPSGHQNTKHGVLCAFVCLCVRCDVCSLVPAEFWEMVIKKCKARNPKVIFLGESIDPELEESRRERDVSA